MTFLTIFVKQTGKPGTIIRRISLECREGLAPEHFPVRPGLCRL